MFVYTKEIVMQDESMVAPCGIDCSKCTIFIAAHDPVAAEKLAEEWRSTWQPDAQADWFQCKGCRGDRSVCWSGDCRIYKCCAEEKKQDSCSQCTEFPCKMLENWAGEYENHRQAFENLKKMRE
jgi:hypothetical protein